MSRQAEYKAFAVAKNKTWKCDRYMFCLCRCGTSGFRVGEVGDRVGYGLGIIRD